MKVLNTLASAAVLLAATVTPASAQYYYYGQQDREYEVTITNASATVFTPILAVAHNSGVKLFEVGTQAGPELTELAESGSPAGFAALAADNPELVGDAQASGGPLGPGQSVVVDLSAPRNFRLLSIAAMLLPTNDSFVGLQSVSLPRFRGQTRSYQAVGYDAGSETNDELCANIPGPQCDGVGLSPDDAGEGYVRVSPGIQGIGDLPGANAGVQYDWRNPVAIVSVKRVR